MDRKDGGPAFPSHDKIHGVDFTTDGMSLRDWFAGMALSGLCRSPMDCWREDSYAEVAFGMADAMLKEREKGHG